jgi:hypothetical protein
MEDMTPTKPKRPGVRLFLAIAGIIVLVIAFGVPSVRDSIVDHVRSSLSPAEPQTRAKNGPVAAQVQKKPQHTMTAEAENQPQYMMPPQVQKQPQHTMTAQVQKKPQHTMTAQAENQPQQTTSARVGKKVARIVEQKMPAPELKMETGASLDHVVTREEQFRVEGKTLSVDNILRAADVREVDANMYYGIRLIRPGDHVWGIHYEILREFFRNEGIALPQGADQPDARGWSSGAGKILKYDEKKAYVYNLQTNKLRSGDINVIYPGEEILIVSMKDVFAHLKGRDLSILNRLHFDGTHLYIVRSNGHMDRITEEHATEAVR